MERTDDGYDINANVNNQNKSTKKTINGTHKMKRSGSKRKKKASKSKQIEKDNTSLTTKSNRKKKKKKKKTKSESVKRIKIGNIENINTNSNDNLNGLHKTYTSPIHSSAMLAQLSHEISDKDLNIPNENSPDIPTPMDKTQNGKHKTNKNSNKCKQYFDKKHFDKNNIKPNEMNSVLNRIEKDLQFIFSDNFLNETETLTTNKIYHLSVSLHKTFIEYKLSFLLPISKIKLIELNHMFSSIIKWFNRYKRYHRSPQIHKHKQQINKLKNNINTSIKNIESNCSIINNTLIKTKQLYLKFHKNIKLLLFWTDLFPKNEIEFNELSWNQFVNSIRNNKSFKKFKSFKIQNMIDILTNNYEILTIEQFLKYIDEYDSVNEWLNDMYKYINEQIKNTNTEFIDSGSSDNNNASDELFDEPFDINNINDLPLLDRNESTCTVIVNKNSSSNNNLVEEVERNEWKKTIKSLEDEITKLKTENYEYCQQIKNYELRLSSFKSQSKQFFSLQTKLDYNEKLLALLRNRCFNLYQQINENIAEFTESINQNDNNKNNKTIEVKISEIQTSLSKIKKNIAEKTKIKTICEDILDIKNTNIIWQQIEKSLQFVLSEVSSIHEQLKDISSPQTPQPIPHTKRVSFMDESESKDLFSPPTPEPADIKDIGTPLFTRPHSESLGLVSNNNKSKHKRQKTYSYEQSNMRGRTYLRSSFTRNKRKHKRFKTATIATINPILLSPHWRHNTHGSTESFDDGVSDVISTLSNVDYQNMADYTFMLDEYYENDIHDIHDIEEGLQYVNINPYQMYHQKQFSIVEPLDILDDKMLKELKDKNNNQLNQNEIEMKNKLIEILTEMDLMGESKLDQSDFTASIMNIVQNYDDIMEDAELLYVSLQDKQDDMGCIKIEIIVDAIVNNKNNDGAAKNIKQQIMIGLNLNIENENKSDDNNNDSSNDKFENMTQLQVKEMEIDPNAQPYKPVYSISNGIQKFGKNSND